MQQTVEGFVRYGDALAMAGECLKSIDSGGWTGAAGDAFHEYFDGEPDRWIGCGQAFHALRGFHRLGGSTCRDRVTLVTCAGRVNSD